MLVKVLSKLEHLVSRLSLKSSLAGNSMLVRLRAGIVALLGLVAAVGLGLIAFVAQQDWPGAFDSPLPEEPAPLVRNDAISPPPSLGRDRPLTAGRESARRDSDRARGAAPATDLTSSLTGSRQAGESAPPPVSPGDAETPAPPEPTPASVSPPSEVSPSQPTAVPVAAGEDDVAPAPSGKSKAKSTGRPAKAKVKAKAPSPPPLPEKDDAADDPKPSYEDPKPSDDDEPSGDDKSYEEKYDAGYDRGRRGRPD